MLSSRLRRALGPAINLDNGQRYGFAEVGSEIFQLLNKAASHLKNRRARAVYFDFNGERQAVTRGESGKSAGNRWKQRSDTRHYRFQRSRRCKRMKAERAREVAENQAKMDALMAGIGDHLSTQRGAVKFFGDFGFCADNGAKFNYKALTSAMYEAGYRPGAHVGKPQEAFDNPTIMAEYIAGQVWSMAAQDGPMPWHMCCVFAERWLAKFPE